MIPSKEILEQIWKGQLSSLDKNNPVVRFQRRVPDAAWPTEYRVCKRCVLIDYSPSEKLEENKLYSCGEHPLLANIDEQRVLPCNLLHNEFIELHDSALLTNWFLPYKDEQHAGMYAMDQNKKGEFFKRMELEATKDGPFRLVGLSLYSIPAWCKEAIYGHSSLVALHGQLGLTKSSYVPTILLSSESSTLIVTLLRTGPDEDPTIILQDNEKLRFDGLIEASKTFARLVQRKEKTKMSKGLTNPVRRSMAIPSVAPAAAPVPAQAPAPAVPAPEQPVEPPVQTTTAPAQEPQVEEVQTEAAEQIASEAPETPKTRRRVKQATQDSNMLSSMEELTAYLGAPVPDTMSVAQIEDEVRHLRDLGIALARRQCNLCLAGAAAGSKIMSQLKSIIG